MLVSNLSTNNQSSFLTQRLLYSLRLQSYRYKIQPFHKRNASSLFVCVLFFLFLCVFYSSRASNHSDVPLYFALFYSFSFIMALRPSLVVSWATFPVFFLLVGLHFPSYKMKHRLQVQCCEEDGPDQLWSSKLLIDPGLACRL